MIKAVIFDMFETLVTHYESPLYFGKQICADIGITESVFREIWDTTEEARTLGKTTLEQVIEDILKTNQRYSNELYAKIIEKRRQAKQACFDHLHREIIPMLEAIRANGMKIGLITNCYNEETDVIRQSVLFPYFDAVCMSCELGLKKPQREIFETCLQMLDLRAEECLYVGDGGSQELEAAAACGMHPRQAAWYFKAENGQLANRRSEFSPVDSPLDILNEIKKYN